MLVYYLIVGLLEETQRKDEEMETLQVKSILREGIYHCDKKDLFSDLLSVLITKFRLLRHI